MYSSPAPVRLFGKKFVSNHYVNEGVKYEEIARKTFEERTGSGRVYSGLPEYEPYNKGHDNSVKK